MAPVFFTSYAYADNLIGDISKEGQLGRVVKELRERVRAKLGKKSAEEVGFISQTTLKTGTEWETAVGNALRTSRVLLCLCSPSFLNSEWCAREFAVFRERLKQAGKEFATEHIVMPVVWEPLRSARPMPAVLSQFQRYNDSFPSCYPKVGLHTLSRLKSMQDQYIETIEQLADDICLAAEGKPLPVLAEFPDFEKLPHSFDNPGHYGVAIGVLHDSGTQWEPAPNMPSVATLVEAVCASLRIPWREIPNEIDLNQQLKDAREAREAVILITDELSAQTHKWGQLLATIDKPRLDHCAILYGYYVPDSSTINKPFNPEQTKQEFLPSNLLGTSFHGAFPLTSVDTFKSKIEEAIVRVRGLIVSNDPAQKVENLELQKAACFEGISLKISPTLSGPGRYDL